MNPNDLSSEELAARLQELAEGSALSRDASEDVRAAAHRLKDLDRDLATMNSAYLRVQGHLRRIPRPILKLWGPR